MDSFYDAPRKLPTPTDLGRIPVSPVVPEVSLLFNNTQDNTNFASYNNWRHHQEVTTTPNPNNNYGTQPNSSTIFKKQVRFQTSATEQQRPFSNNYQQCFYQSNSTNNHENEKRAPLPNVISNKAFEQIYMANIPNRQLDLSMLDVPRSNNLINSPEVTKENVFNSTTKENNLPGTYKDFLAMQSNVNDHLYDDSVTDILNYSGDKYKGKKQTEITQQKFPKISDNACFQISKPSVPQEMSNKITINHDRDVFSRETYSNYQKEREYFNTYNNCNARKVCDNNTQTSTVFNQRTVQQNPQTVPEKNPDEPTVKDLLKIIQQQNEQLILLQKQVANLIEYNNETAQKQIEPPPSGSNNNDYVTSTRHENYNNPILSDVTNKSPRKGPPVSKFSIDLMTSFEVSFRPQQNMYQRKLKDYPNYEPKIQEITEVDSVDISNKDTRNMEQSFLLEEPLRVRESCPSPDPVVKINMNDYDESDEETSTSNIGMSFYANLMEQVNNILKNAQTQAPGDYRKNPGNENTAYNNTTMHKVKEATLKHLKSIGVNLPPSEDMNNSIKSNNDSTEFTPTEVSFAVKQLLMKYLPDDHLSKLTNNQKPKVSNPCTEQIPKLKENLIKARPEFSFATVQYMKKYNLLGNDSSKAAAGNNTGSPKNVHQFKPFDRNPQMKKILDISDLKQQPKLL